MSAVVLPALPAGLAGSPALPPWLDASGTHFSAHQPFSLSVQIPLFKGEIISFCATGLDQRQFLSSKQSQPYAGGSLSVVASKKRTGFLIPFPGLQILMPWKPQQENWKCFPQTNTPIMPGMGGWQSFPVWHHSPLSPRGRANNPFVQSPGA